MTVREATPGDTSAIAGVLAAVAEEDVIATEPPVDVEVRARQLRERIEAGGPAGSWVLENGGRVVGSAGVEQHGMPGVLSLGMAILPEARGRGGGRALLKAIVAHACRVGAHKLELEVWPTNARAIALYVSEGFEVEGTRRDHYRRRDGSLRSAVVMARLLSAPCDTSASAQHVLECLHHAQGDFYAGGDDGPLRAALTEDVVWHVPGCSPIAGRYAGIEAVMAYFTRRRDLASQTFKMFPGEVLTGGGDHVAVLTDGAAVIGGEPRRWSTVGLYRVQRGRVASCWLLPLDQDQFDAIWSA